MDQADSSVVDACKKYQLAIRKNPERWIRDALGITLWGPQIKVVRSVFQSDSYQNLTPKKKINKVAWRTGHAVGKSYLAAAVAITAVQAYSPRNVITTGSSWNGIEKILWPTIRKTLSRAPVDIFPGAQVLNTELKLGDGWGIFGISTNEVENFAGYHGAIGPLVIIDEASALSYEIYESILGLCSTAGSTVFAIGNPIDPSGPFFDMFSDPEIDCYHTSSMDTPNAKSGTTVIPGLCEREYINSVRNTYGEKSHVFQSRVAGNFPKSAEDSLITMEMIEDAQKKNAHKLKDEFKTDRLKLGVDVARFGGDKTVFLIRDDISVIHIKWFLGQDLMQTCGNIVEFVKEWGITENNIFVDDSGIGGGVTDRLRELDYAVTAVCNGEKPLDDERFINVRAETYWYLREAIQDGFMIPDTSEEMTLLSKELVIPKYKLRSNGKIVLEEKAEIRKRLRASPDRADALAMTFYPNEVMIGYL